MIEPLAGRSVRARLRPGRTHVGTLVAIIVMGGLVTLGVTKMNISAASDALGHASLIWVAVAALSVAAAWFARSESWYAALRTALPDRPVCRPVVIRGLLIGVAASTVAPARAGEGIRTWLVSRRIGGKCVVSTVVGTVIAQTVLNLVALALLALVVITSSDTRGLHLATVGKAVAIPILLILGVVAVTKLIGVLGPKHRTADAPGRFTRASGWLGRQMAGTGRGMSMFSRPGPLLHAGIPQIGAWALQWFACFAVMEALGLQNHASPAAAAAVLLAINLSAAVPITPGNVGVFQAACIAVLTPLGVASSDALAYGLLLQGIEIAVALTLAIPAALQEGLSLRDLSRAATDGASLAVAPG